MGAFREIAKLIGWLSGSLAGLAAILYSCGYLASQTYLHLLGFGGLVVYDYQTYLQRGANFMVDALGLALSVLLTLAAALILIGVLGYPLLVSARRLSGPARLALLGTRLAAIHKGHPLVGRGILYCGLLLLFFLLLYQNLALFQAPLNVSGLLYDADELVRMAADKSNLMANIAAWIVNDESLALKGYFTKLVILELAAGLILLSAWRVTGRLPFRQLLVAPFVIVFVLYVCLLPMVYGPLMVKLELAPVSITTAGKALGQKHETYYLVTALDDGFTLWSPGGKRLLWLPKRDVQAVEIMRKELPFKPLQGLDEAR